MPHLVPGTNVSLLTKNRHLDCYAWSIPAGPGVCAGFNLEGDSVCRMCYAGQGFYRMPVVENAQQVRLEWWRKRKNIRSIIMTHAIRSATKRNPYFRVFESGDFTDAEDVDSWREIIRRCPETKFWVSTRAWRNPDLRPLIAAWLTHPNVVVRYSGLEVNDSRRKILNHLPKSARTSSVVDYGKGCPKQIYGSCTLGACRACWDPKVKHIEYKVHGNLVKWRKS